MTPSPPPCEKCRVVPNCKKFQEGAEWDRGPINDLVLIVYCPRHSGKDADRYKAALKQYGEHRAGCKENSGLEPCTCGLDTALTEPSHE